MTTHTVSNTSFRSQIQNAAKETPRFLFRFWSSKSGGHPHLNTVYAHTPKAFLQGSNVRDYLWLYDPGEVDRIATEHLLPSYNVVTIFSSWCQSLPFIISWAKEKLNDTDDMHISLLDTTKLGTKNVVFHTSALHRVLRNFVFRPSWPRGSYKHEYLAFEVIKTPAIRATKFHDFIQLGAVQAPLSGRHLTSPIDHDLRKGINSVLCVSSTYGLEFEVVMAAHLIPLAANNGAKIKQFIEELAEWLAVPDRWVQDSTITAPEGSLHGYDEAASAEAILISLVFAARAVRVGKTDVHPEFCELFVKSNARASGRIASARKAMRKPVDTVDLSPQVPKLVKEHYKKKMVEDLRITMTGFEHHKGFLDRVAYERGRR